MKTLDLSLAVSPNIALFTAGTIDFLQQSWKEGFNATIIAMIGSSYSTSTVYILWGCAESVVVISPGSTTTIAPGAVFYNGEIYVVPGSSFATPSGGNVVVANLPPSHYSDALGGDPMTFTVTGASNVHNNRFVVFASGASGGGTLSGTSASDYGNILQLFGQWKNITSFGSGWTGGTTIAGNVAQYRYFPFSGEVQLRGVVVSTSTTPSGFLATITGLKIANAMYCSTAFYTATGTVWSAKTIALSAAGSNTVITVANIADEPTEANDAFSLDNISFYIN